MKMWKLSTIFLAFCLLNLGWCASIDDRSEESSEEVDDVKATVTRGYVTLNELRFYFSESNEDTTWEGALTACTAIDMQLATLDNSAKDNTILGYVEQNMGTNVNWWAAGKRPAGEQSWSWVTNGQIFRYLNWVADEPGTNYSNEGCLQTTKIFSPVEDRGWGEMDCKTSKFPYVCEDIPSK